MTNFIRMIKDESGAAAAEYALILAIVGAGIVVAAVALGSSITDAIDCSAVTISAGTSTLCVDGTAGS